VCLYVFLSGLQLINILAGQTKRGKKLFLSLFLWLLSGDWKRGKPIGGENRKQTTTTTTTQ